MLFNKHPRCQLECLLGQYTPLTWLRQVLKSLRSRVGLRTRLRKYFSRKHQQTKRLGVPSRFSAGTWVRVLDEARIREKLDDNNKLRGLLFAEQQWPYCGTTHQVLKPVQRMMDDTSTMRPISRTVLIDTVPCGGKTGQQGCGRECPMMYRDEWLEEVPPPLESSIHLHSLDTYATVRCADEIKLTLDASDSHNGLMFMPEMFNHSGSRYRVLRKIDQVWGPGQYIPIKEPVYLLEDLYCTGAVLGEDGPCDRGCRLLWHKDWLHLTS